ncbi:MAG: hypothetical protein IJQ85_04505 [Selenomonadaceae bacterium]|nr:hypothetical protein [Selenomonadaceae bacterium]
MPIKKTDMVISLAESLKNFFVDLSRPNMTIENISEIVSPRLDDLIKNYEARGLTYGAGKFSIKYADENHFQLEFEMYFQDNAGKWHKCADTSDKRDVNLLEAGAWKTIKSLKVVTFPIEKPTADDLKEKFSVNKGVAPIRPKKSPDGEEVPAFNELAAYLRGAKNWQEFEIRLKDFLDKVPFALKDQGVENYVAKIFSFVEGNTLGVIYKLYYKENGEWIERSVFCEIDESAAPTWATKSLSAEFIDVTARYEKNFHIAGLDEIPSLKKLSSYLHGAKNWNDFETRLKKFSIMIPFVLKKISHDDYGAKLFSFVEGDTLRVIHRMYYKEDGKWVEYNTFCDLNELQAPTWATKNLSEKESDVTARYEKNFRVTI